MRRQSGHLPGAGLERTHQCPSISAKDSLAILLFLLFLQEIYSERSLLCRRNPRHSMTQPTKEQRGTPLWFAVLVMHLMNIVYTANIRYLERNVAIQLYHRNYCL
jgi:hypothetical protein